MINFLFMADFILTRLKFVQQLFVQLMALFLAKTMRSQTKKMINEVKSIR